MCLNATRLLYVECHLRMILSSDTNIQIEEREFSNPQDVCMFYCLSVCLFVCVCGCLFFLIFMCVCVFFSSAFASV